MPILEYSSWIYRSIYKDEEYEYKSFSPSSINKPFEWKDKIDYRFWVSSIV